MFEGIVNKIKKILFIRKWRSCNSHNQTVPGAVFPIELVKAGAYTYGIINLIHFDPNNTKYQLVIGNFVSIAPNVNFLLCENHQTSTFATFPLKSVFDDIVFYKDAECKGSIIIEDEVWIGFGVTILSGVTIGKGAIVATGAVVTSSIPPYTVAAGIPAKIIRHRFSEEITSCMISLKLIDLPKTVINKNLDLFYKKIDSLEDLTPIQSLFKRTINERNN